MNAEFHKAQAEALIKQANSVKSNRGAYWRDNFHDLVDLANIHAILATVPDKED